MIRVEIETTIKRPIEEVFDRLVDINGYSEWLPKSRVFLGTRQTSEGPVDVSTTFEDKTTIGTFRGEVTAFQRPTKVNFRMRLRRFGMNVLESRPGYTLQSVDGGTNVHLLAAGELYGIFKLVQPYVAVRAREERKRTLDVLKKTLESHPPSHR